MQKHFIANAVRRKNAKLANLRDIAKYKRAVRDIETRIVAISHHLAKCDDPQKEAELRAGYRATLLSMLLDEVGLEHPAGLALPEPERRWKRIVLTRDHVAKFGDRTCETCGKPVYAPSPIYYSGNVIQHEACHKKDGWRVYEYTATHVAKHGASVCEVCGLPVDVGQMVAWRPGKRSVIHEVCRARAGD